MVSMPVLTSAKKCKTENRRRFEMSWEKNSSFLVLSFVTTESISLQKKTLLQNSWLCQKPGHTKEGEMKLHCKIFSKSHLSQQNWYLKQHFVYVHCWSCLYPWYHRKGHFFSTRISRKLESYYYNVKNLESYGNIPKLHLRQQRCVRCT